MKSVTAARWMDSRGRTQPGARSLCALLAAGLLLSFSLASCGVTTSRSRSTGSALIHLPRDNAMHPSAETEWWYVVGHLAASGGRTFGFETTLFKLRHVPVPRLNQSINLDRTDVALTDVQDKRYLPTVSYILPGSGASVRLSSKAFFERAGDLVLSGSGQHISLESSTQGYSIRLTLTTRRPPLLEGGTGLIPMGAHGLSYYYSLTDLTARGSIVHGAKVTPVHGIAWLDHQWGRWDWSHIRGWTWGAFQMANGTNFSISDFHAVGRSLHGVSVSLSDGAARVVRSISIRARGHWRSPHDGALYPSGWIVSIPGLRARLTVTPLLDDQEVYDRLNPSMSYWEGACVVTGVFEGRKAAGRAYMELVGVAGRFGTL